MSDEDAARDETSGPPEASMPDATTARRRRRLASIGLIVGGLALATYASTIAPRDQHLRFVLGDAAPHVSRLEVEYVAPSGETVRTTTLRFERGQAPRVVAHEPSLANGPYTVHVRVDTGPSPSAKASDATGDGPHVVDRHVELTGGTTSIDLSRALIPAR